MNQSRLVAWTGSSEPNLAVVFTDIVGSAALANELGDSKMKSVRTAHYSQTRHLIVDYSGYEIKTIGDAFLVVFKAASDALRFALALNKETGDERVKIRAGMHIGDVTVEENDIHGATVNFASRIVECAEEDEVWVSNEAKRSIEEAGASDLTNLRWTRHVALTLKSFPISKSAWSVAPADHLGSMEERQPVPYTLASSEAPYVITYLGTLGGDISRAKAINESGVVVGESKLEGRKTPHAFVFESPNEADLTSFHPSNPIAYEASRMRDLGALGPTSSSAEDINDAGMVVGMTTIRTSPATGGGPYHAFLYKGQIMKDINALGQDESHASGLNSCGLVVGYSVITLEPESGKQVYRAFVYFAGRAHYLESLVEGGHSGAASVNDDGDIVGWSRAADGEPHAVVFGEDHLRDLGTLGGKSSYASDINSRGQVTGRADGPHGLHAFLSEESVMRDLGTLETGTSEASAINDFGQVVGRSSVASGGHHAFIYSDGRMTDLNDMIPPDSGWELTDATDINNAGQIVGCGYLNGSVGAFLLTPRD
jgi:probable HAF family extracellular repeat protein